MTWWVFSYLDNYRPPHGLGVFARTPEKAHMFIRWSKIKPVRKLRYRRIRGTTTWCGYTYWWNGAHTHEQLHPGDTYKHFFGLIPLDPWDHVWYYLFSMIATPYLEHQGPLIHVPPPELPMPTARIFHSVPQLIPSHAHTILVFDSVMWDDYGFYDPAQPDRLTVPVGALYDIGCSFRYETTLPAGISASIKLGPVDQIVQHTHYVNGNNWPGTGFSMQTIIALRPGDYLQVETYHTSGPARNIVIRDFSSPHFWIAQIGAYPISAP